MEEKKIIEIIELTKQDPEKKKCKSCQKFTSVNLIMLVFSFYILFAAIYGTIKICHELYNYFNSF